MKWEILPSTKKCMLNYRVLKRNLIYNEIFWFIGVFFRLCCSIAHNYCELPLFEESFPEEPGPGNPSPPKRLQLSEERGEESPDPPSGREGCVELPPRPAASIIRF